MSLDWNSIASFAALVAALAAIFALIQQSRLSRFTIRLELLWKLEERFSDNPQMRGSRLNAARSLLNGTSTGDLDTVIDFFEVIGLYVKSGVLDRKMVWNMFFHRAIGYWYASQERILELRSRNTAIWENYEYLISVFLKIESRVTNQPVVKIVPTKEDLIGFLEDEVRTLEGV